MKRAHQQASALIKARQDSWTSHTVIIVDQSGSMRKTDVDGGSTRSDAVWLTVAVDFVAKQLETGKSSDTDVVSVVAMCSESTIVIDRQPHDWLLFNRLVDLLRSQEPHFDGNYMPALGGTPAPLQHLRQLCTDALLSQRRQAQRQTPRQIRR